MKNRKIMIAGMLICAITAGCGTALPHADGRDGARDEGSSVKFLR